MKILSGGRFAPVGAMLIALGFSIVWCDVAVAKAPNRDKAQVEAVDLFEAIDSGDVEVRVIPKDESKGNVLIKNKSDKPLAIRLPEAFAAVPVAAQIGFPGVGAPGLNGGNGLNNPFGNQVGLNGQQPQAIGGGLNGNGLQGNGVGLNGPFNGGIFKVEPGKVGKIKFTSVCLEHGKPTPDAHDDYEFKRVEAYSSDPGLQEMVKMLGRGEIDQKTAQAAAWHLANGMSWDQLATKTGRHFIGGRRESYFTAAQIDRAQKIVKESQRRAEYWDADQKSDSLAGKQ